MRKAFINIHPRQSQHDREASSIMWAALKKCFAQAGLSRSLLHFHIAELPYYRKETLALERVSLSGKSKFW
jgi:hypothetical protein